MSNPTEMGIRIRDVRRERGWTQDQLANAVGVSRSAVAQWETGRAGQVTTNLTRIAEVLEVGVEYLMYGDDKRAPAEARLGDELALSAAVSGVFGGGPPASVADRTTPGRRFEARGGNGGEVAIVGTARDR